MFFFDEIIFINFSKSTLIFQLLWSKWSGLVAFFATESNNRQHSVQIYIRAKIFIYICNKKISMNNDFLQAHMSENICFGCGQKHPDGLQIKSIWQGDEMICEWTPQEKYQGWKNLLNGGIMATLMDCHTMATATAYAYKIENDRDWDSEPVYRYATGTLNIKYLKPTPIQQKITLKARVIETKGKKTIVNCEIWSGNEKTAEGQVVAIRVFDSSQDNSNNIFNG